MARSKINETNADKGLPLSPLSGGEVSALPNNVLYLNAQNELCMKLGGTEKRIVSAAGDVVGLSGLTIASVGGVISTNPSRKIVFLNATVVETNPALYEVTVTPISGGSSTTLPITVTAMTDITISHTLGRPPVVAVYHGQSEVKCTVSLPVGQELTHVRVQSSFPITGFIIIA